MLFGCRSAKMPWIVVIQREAKSLAAEIVEQVLVRWVGKPLLQALGQFRPDPIDRGDAVGGGASGLHQAVGIWKFCGDGFCAHLADVMDA